MKTDIKSIVGIGASAGGLETIKEFLQNIQPDTGFAFIIIQHLSPDHKSLMADLLKRYTQMPISVVKEKTRISKNQVYLIAPNTELYIEDGFLYPESRKGTVHHGVDLFFNSLAEVYQQRSVGIILTGTITDGSQGIRAIKEKGGIVMAQAPAEAKFDGMPVSAIQTGLVDYVNTVKGLANEINRLSRQKSVLPELDQDLDVDTKELLSQVIHQVRLTTGTDFSYYKPPTLLRRIEKRIRMLGIGSIEEYLNTLLKDEQEVKQLAQEYYISVSSFFRDPQVWQLVEKHVIADLFKGKSSDEEVRIWVPGCATGEEAYSFAILLATYSEIHRPQASFRIFATDVDRRSLNVASAGLYTKAQVETIPAHYLERYFEPRNGAYKITKALRERVIFSQHNLITDPPFIRMDMISCRNTLIYLKARTQQLIFKRFLFSLNANGFLLLGNSESLGASADFFHQLNNHSNLFQLKRKASVQELRQASTGLIPSSTSRRTINVPESAPSGRQDFSSQAQDFYASILVKEHAPPSLFVRYNFELLYIYGDFHDILNLPQKRLAPQLLNMVSPELGAIMRHGIEKLKIEGKPVLIKEVQLPSQQHKKVYDICFKDTWNEEYKEHNVLIQFFMQDIQAADTHSLTESVRSNDYLMTLERALEEKDREIHFLQDQIDSSNEALQASNEELQSSNEELQSSNEELQSVNEELQTLNAELKNKIDEVLTANNDLNKVLHSTNIGALFVDDELHIRRFTDRVVDIIPLKQEDLGRVLLNFTTSLKRNHLSKDFSYVLKKRKAFKREVSTVDGKHFLCHISPVTLPEDKTDGAVAIFIDLTDKIQAEWQLREINKRLEAAVEVANLGFVELDLESQEMESNLQLNTLLGYPEPHAIQLKEFIAAVHPEERHALEKNILDAVNERQRSFHMEFRLQTYDHQVKHFFAVGNLLQDTKLKQRKMLITFTDLTRLRESQEHLNQLGKLLEQSLNEIYVFSAQTLRFILVNEGARTNLGFSMQELEKMTPLDIKPEFNETTFTSLISPLRAGEEELIKFETVHKRKDGSLYNVLVNLQMFQYQNQEVFVAIILDTTELVNTRTELNENKERLELAIFGTNDGIWDWPDLNSDYNYWSPRLYEILGTTPEETPASTENFAKLIHPEDAPYFRERLENHLAYGTPYEVEVRVRNLQSGYRWCKTRGRALRREDGTPYRMAGGFTDIHEQKLAELQITESNRQLQIANDHLDNFVYAAAHDLRSPIVNLKSLISLLSISEKNTSVVVDKIDESVDRLERTLGNMIKVLELQQENQPTTELLSFEDCIAEVIADLQPSWDKVNPELRLSLEVKHITFVPPYLHSILHNLLSNALKYREMDRPLKITISTQKLHSGRVLVQVKDNGIGMEVEAVAHKLFRPFVRLSRQREGNGIGLYLIKTLIEKNGGNIYLEGKKGKGICVTLELVPYANLVESKVR